MLPHTDKLSGITESTTKLGDDMGLSQPRCGEASEGTHEADTVCSLKRVCGDSVGIRDSYSNLQRRRSKNLAVPTRKEKTSAVFRLAGGIFGFESHPARAGNVTDSLAAHQHSEEGPAANDNNNKAEVDEKEEASRRVHLHCYVGANSRCAASLPRGHCRVGRVPSAGVANFHTLRGRSRPSSSA